MPELGLRGIRVRCNPPFRPSPSRGYIEAMRILYGVVGEGMGHAMRSRVVLEHLLRQGHEVETMVSGRAAEFLKMRFAGVNRIHGLHIIYEENRDAARRCGRTCCRAPPAYRRTSPPTSS